MLFKMHGNTGERAAERCKDGLKSGASVLQGPILPVICMAPGPIPYFSPPHAVEY